MQNIPVRPLSDAPVFRKIAMGTWRNAGDPSTYGLLDIDMSRAKPYMEALSQISGIKITPAHLVGKAISLVLAERPEINGFIRGSRIYLRPTIDLFYQVNVPGKGEGDSKVKKASLSGATVRQADRMTVLDIAKALQAKALAVRENKDKELSSTLKTMKLVPWALMSWVLNITSFFVYGLNIRVPGLPRDPFGSVMITNVGSLGIDWALAPLVPYSRVPLLLAVGTMKEAVDVDQGHIVVRPKMTIGVTFDHRFMDGVHAAHMAKRFKQCFSEPETYFGPVDEFGDALQRSQEAQLSLQ